LLNIAVIFFSDRVVDRWNKLDQRDILTVEVSMVSRTNYRSQTANVARLP